MAWADLGPAFDSVLNTYGQIRQRKDAAEERRYRDEQRAKAERREQEIEADRMAIRQAFAPDAEGNVDLGQASARVMPIDPVLGINIRRQAGADEDAQRARLEAELADIVRFFGDATEASWKPAIAMYQQKWPRTGRDIPDEYDPVVRDQIVRLAMTTQQRLEADRTAREARRESNRAGVGGMFVQPDGSPDPAAAARELYKLGDYEGSKVVGGALPQPDEPTPGSFEDFLTSYAHDRGTTPKRLPSREKIAARREWEAAGRAPRDENTDTLYTRDRQEYADYVREHDKAQEGRTVPAVDPETGRPTRFAPPVKAPYERAMTFEEWRRRVKRRGPAGETITAPPPGTPPPTAAVAGMLPPSTPNDVAVVATTPVNTPGRGRGAGPFDGPGGQPAAGAPRTNATQAPITAPTSPAINQQQNATPTTNTVTEAELAAIATRRGTSVDQERARATAAGYRVVR